MENVYGLSDLIIRRPEALKFNGCPFDVLWMS